MICLLSIILVTLIPAYQWQSIPSPGIRAYCHTVIYDPDSDLFFIMGGDSTGYYTNMDICLEFDPKTNTWDTKEPMNIAKRGHAASYINGFIHVLGGRNNSGNFVTRHEVYDISSNSWDTAAPSPLPITYYPSLVTWRDSVLYLLGGYPAITNVYLYDPATDSWDSASSLPRRFHLGGVKIKGDSIFIVGGGDGGSLYTHILLGEINPNNLTEINWSWKGSLPIAENYNNGLAIKNNKAYMIGGAFDMGTNEVWEYDIPDESWSPLPDYPTNIIMRGQFAERRDGPDSLGIVYSFMGDTSDHSSNDPTDECFRLAVTENDAGMLAINSPVSDTMIESFVQVNGTVKNYGINTYSFKTYVNIYDPDHLIAFSDSSQVDNLVPSDTLNIDFGSFQLTKGGTYTVEMFTYASDDTYTLNDSLTTTFNSSDYLWQSIPSPGIKTCDHAVVYDPNNDLFFIIGGDSSGSNTYMDICLEFDPSTNEWDTMAPMPTGRGRYCTVYRDGYIHALCGRDEDVYLSTHEVYDINANSWYTAASAPLAVFNPCAALWRDSLIYFMGGYSPPSAEVYYYNPPTDSWHPATSLPQGLHGAEAEIKGDSIFIIGASSDTRILMGQINPSDPSDINWSWGVSLPGYNYLPGVALKNNKIYMIGGNFDLGTNQVWEYDILEETWTALPDYPTRIIMRGEFAAKRDGPDSSGVVYCFMGDTSDFTNRKPTNECFRLIRIPEFGGIE